MKRILSLVLTIVLVVTLFAGCSSNSATTTENSTEANQSTAATQSETKTAEQVTGEINYFTWRISPGTEGEKVITDFMTKNPGIKVNLDSNKANVEQFLNSQKIKLMSGDNIDVTSIRPESRADYVKAGYLTELKDEPFLQNFNESALNTIKVDGKLYGIPSAANIIGVYYNKDMFTKYNVKAPTNWDEFLAACDTFKKAGVDPLIQGGKDGWPMEFDVYPFFHQLLVKDPDLFSKIDKGEIKYTDPMFIDTYKKVADFYKLGYVYKNTLSLPYSGAEATFRQGKAAMFIQGEWAMADFVNENKASFEIGVFPLPYNAAGEEIVVPVGIGSSEAVVASTKNKAAAMKFMEYLASPEGSAIYAKGVSSFVPVKGAPSDFNPLAKDWAPLLDMKSVDFFYNLQFPGANSEMVKQLQTLFAGKTTPEEMGKAIQAAQDKKAK